MEENRLVFVLIHGAGSVLKISFCYSLNLSKGSATGSKMFLWNLRKLADYIKIKPDPLSLMGNTTMADAGTFVRLEQFEKRQSSLA